MVGCKIFNTGTIHFTGSNTFTMAHEAFKLLINRLLLMNGSRMIRIQQNDYLMSHDFLLFNTNGEIIGWKMPQHGFFLDMKKDTEYPQYDQVMVESNKKNNSLIFKV